jgi:hypothetical protein
LRIIKERVGVSDEINENILGYSDELTVGGRL